MHGDQVLQVHAQDGDLEPLTLAVGFTVRAVVPLRRHQVRHLTPDLLPMERRKTEVTYEL